MPIAKRPQHANTMLQDDAAAVAFIDAAGSQSTDAPKPARGKKIRGKKIRVMAQFDEKVLARMDAVCARRGMSRSAWLQYLVSEALAQE